MPSRRDPPKERLMRYVALLTHEDLQTPHKQQMQENHTVASMMEGGHWLFSQLNIYECN